MEASTGRTKPETITDRELDILRYIARGLSNREIALEIHLSLDTIKWYNKRIFGKLGVGSRTQAIVQARELGLLADEPDIRAHRNNLPVQATPFIGRENELARIKRLLADVRLVTLTGPGGIGKTRLALQAAGDLLDDFANGIFFVSMAPVESANKIVPIIAEALAFPLVTHEDPRDQLLRHLRSRQYLLIVDNFEHLLVGAPVLSELLHAAPNVVILATSREKLNLQEETVLRIEGMAYPRENSAGGVLDYGAMQLFVHSARRARPDFALVGEDLQYVTTACQLVEGMPLAIMLAAAWADMLSPEEIAAEISHRLDFLTTELRNVPERHRSIRAVIDSSWNRLTEEEQALFKMLAVFRGGFTRQAAEQVAGGSLSTLAGLVNKSLLRSDPQSGRFEIHELLRQYADEHLNASKQACAVAYEAHAAYFADFMQQHWEQLKGSQQVTALHEIEADIDNLRSAWRYCLNERDHAQVRMFIDGFWWAYSLKTWLHDGQELFREAVQALGPESGQTGDEGSDAVLARVMAHQADFLARLGYAEQGLPLAEAGVAILRRLNRRAELILPLVALSLNSYFVRNSIEAIQLGQEGIELAREVGNRWLLARQFVWQSNVAAGQQEFARARQHAQESIRLFEVLGDRFAQLWPRLELGHADVSFGEFENAKEQYRWVFEASQKLDICWFMSSTARYLGEVALLQDQAAQAENYLLRSLRISEELGSVRDMINVLVDLGAAQATQGRLTEAVQLLAFVFQHPISEQTRTMSVRLGESAVRIRDYAESLLSELGRQLPPEAYSAARERGLGLDLEEVVADLLELRRD